jgi:cell division transport system permease protein
LQTIWGISDFTGLPDLFNYLYSKRLMAENKKISIVSFFNSRVTSVISIALVLFLLGLIFLMALLGSQLSDYVKENISFSVILKDEVREADIKRIQKNLNELPFIKSTEYISKEQAAKELEAELGENPETFLGFNPLQASIEVRLHSEYANTDSLQVIEKKLKSYTSISDLLYRKDMMQIVNENIKRVGVVLLTLALMLMAISFVLISNTIRLLIYSKRFLIHTMQLVGATPEFIRRPFVNYNVVSGVFASILAILMLIGALYYLQRELAGFVQMLDTGTLLLVFVSVFILGIILSVVATVLAVNRYLHMEVDKLYYI